MKTAIELIKQERIRQVEEEGFGLNSDDRYSNSELVLAAACYALVDWARKGDPDSDYSISPEDWPWGEQWWKPSPDNPIKELVKAGALIVAEIERLQRKQN